MAELVQKFQAEKQELMNTMVRRQADFENYRKRMDKERQQDRHAVWSYSSSAFFLSSMPSTGLLPARRGGFGRISQGFRAESAASFGTLW